MKRIFLAAILLFLGVTLAMPWSPMWRTEEDMNLVSGRVRSIHRVCFIPVSTAIADTPVSREVSVADDDAAWVPVNHFGLWPRNSPHFIYHSAMNDVCVMGRAFAESHWDARARRLAASHFLQRLRETGNGTAAGVFARNLWERTMDHAGPVDEALVEKAIAAAAEDRARRAKP